MRKSFLLVVATFLLFNSVNAQNVGVGTPNSKNNYTGKAELSAKTVEAD